MSGRDEQMRSLLKKAYENLNTEPHKRTKEKHIKPQQPKKETIKSYLIKFFKGKSGWRYVGLSKPGSMFTTSRDKNIVSITLHKTPPTLLSNGKYESESTIFIECVRLRDEYSDFEGLVVDNKHNVYMGSTITYVQDNVDSAFIQEPNKTFIESSPEDVFTPVDADEFELASTEYLKHLAESVNKTNEQFNKLSKFFKDNEIIDSETQTEMDDLEKKLNDLISNSDMDSGLDKLKTLSKSMVEVVDKTAATIATNKELADVIENNDNLGCQSN